MIATAHIAFDRNYFEQYYDEWLRHRSKYRKYEIWFAGGLLLFGIAMVIAVAEQRLVGGLITCGGVYEFLMAATHKRRWVRSRVSTAREDRCTDVVFDRNSLTTTSTNESATIQYTGFVGFVPASKGFFLIKDAGASIYVPRSSVEPIDSYSKLMDLFESAVGCRQPPAPFTV